MAEEDKKEDQEEEELVPVGEGLADESKESEESSDEEKEKKEEESSDDGEDDDEDEDDETRLGSGEDAEEDGDKKARRKKERKSRSQRQKSARARDKREITFLQQRNEQLERRFSDVEQRVGHGEVSQVDTRINKVKSEIQLADQVISKAIEQQDGGAYTEAQGIRDGLRDDLTKLNYVKESLSRRGDEETQPPDPILVGHAQQFVADHDWWDPSGRDADSRKVSQIDAGLVREGFDPLSAEYWTELADRVEDALPHKFENGADEDAGATRKKKVRKKSGSGPKMRVGGREQPLKKNEVYISPDRKKALEDAGVWDDPELRQKYLKSYAKFDREATSNA